MDEQPDNKPTPDPTILTTEQLLREVDRVKELMTATLVGVEAVMQEKFASVERQFASAEQQRIEQKVDTKAAVDAALIAQKEAVKEQTIASERAISKTEDATAKQLEQLNATFTTAINGVRASLQDVKDRVAKLETMKQGNRETVSGIYAFAGFLAAVLILAGALLALQKA